MTLTQDIKSRLSFRDLLEELTGEQIKKVTKCHNHDDHKASMAVYDDGAYCFVCCRQFDHFDVWMHHKRVNFLTALDDLALRAGVQTSRNNKQNLIKQRQKEDALEVVTSFYEMRLWSPQGIKCLDYAKSRGWSEDTIRSARLGWAAPDLLLSEQLKKLNIYAKGVIAQSGFDFCSHQDGYKLSQDGFLVYPHIYGKRVQYMAARSITPGTKEHRNLPGKKLLYYNHAYSPQAKKCFIVEGQADAISLGELEYCAVAICGSSLSEVVK